MQCTQTVKNRQEDVVVRLSKEDYAKLSTLLDRLDRIAEDITQ